MFRIFVNFRVKTRLNQSKVEKKLKRYKRQEAEMNAKFELIQNYLETLESSIYKFNEELGILVEEFTKKMNSLTRKAKMKRMRGSFGASETMSSPPHPRRSRSVGGGEVGVVNMASELWKTVMVITNGIETSVKATEDIKDFGVISERDYQLSNKFEINHA